MSRKLSLMFAAALMAGAASLAAANAATVQLVQSHVTRINSCQESISDSIGNSIGRIDRTCVGSACMLVDIGRAQKTVGPTIPVGC